MLARCAFARDLLKLDSTHGRQPLLPATLRAARAVSMSRCELLPCPATCSAALLVGLRAGREPICR